jgi:hypothetical protein
MYRRRVCTCYSLALRLSSEQGRLEPRRGSARTWLAWTYSAAGRDVEELGETTSAARQDFGEVRDRDYWLGGQAWSRR